eukprot:gene22471-28599_t
MERFPTVQTLAAATPDEVNQSWAGLGYYRRAQQLLKGAQFVVNNFDGVVPSNVTDLLRIPGVGPYTAGAISSIAFNLPEPLVDGNVIRVFSRMYAISLEVGATGGAMEKRCWSLAAQLVDPLSPGDFNQSLMELGATVCKPLNPMCGICPVRSVCKAHQLVSLRGDQKPEDCDADLPVAVTYFPRKVPKKRAREVAVSVCVFGTQSTSPDGQDGETKYLFNRRPDSGLLANQWEFPSVVLPEEEEEEEEPENSGDAEETDSPAAAPSSESLWSPFPSYLRDSLGIRLVSREADSAPVDFSKQSDERMVMFECEAASSSSPPRVFEPIVHVFSHQRHTMHISVRHIGFVDTRSDVAFIGPVVRWMTAAEIVAEGITTGCKKVLQAVETPPKSDVKKAKKAKKIVADAGSMSKKSKVMLEADDSVTDIGGGSNKSKNAFDVMRRAATSAAAIKKDSADKKGTLEMTAKKRKPS